MGKLRIGIIEEGKSPADERAAFVPRQCRYLMDHFPCEVAVQPSKVRRIPDGDYAASGTLITDDIPACDILFGIKEVPVERLIPGKTYVFFSHTIKKQAHNRKLLRAILDMGIKLIDYECMVDSKGLRLLGFGKYAGIVGAYSGLRMMGLKEGIFSLKKAYDCSDEKEMMRELNKVKLPQVKICLTGMGRVSTGAMHIMDTLGIKRLSPEDYLKGNADRAVYTLLDVTDYNKRKDGSRGEMFDFFKNPAEYVSDFRRFAYSTDFYITCHFWHPLSPRVIDADLLADEAFRIRYISDISCDIDGSVASTIRSSSISSPYYGVDRRSLAETDFMQKDALAVMAVDNLPCELPVDASRDFGDQLISRVIPSLFNGDTEGIISRAVIAENGKLTEKYSYLQDYADGK